MAPTRTFNPALPLLAFGLVTFGLAGLSIVDMLVLRPYDGLALASEAAADGLVVREVVAGSGAERAGIRPGDRILGIGRNKLRRAGQAPEALSRFRSGDTVPYLVRQEGGIRELPVRLDRRSFVEGTYVYSAALGFTFFLVGLFVLIRQPGLRASQVFFMLCGLLLLFLVCRLRPPSYSPVNGLILGIGTLAFLFLPPTFFHFYLIFPRPVTLAALSRRRWTLPLRQLGGYAWLLVYLVPPAVFCAAALVRPRRESGLIHGAPAASWWLLALYIVLGLTALGVNTRHLDEPRERRGALLVLAGSLFGLVPFLAASLVLSAALQSRVFFFAGVMPLALVPITFTYAVVRFQLLDIRVILRRSLLYTVITALVTGVYAGAVATFNSFFRDTALAASGYFPIFLALAIVLLFEPLRRQMQELIDRYFFAERSRLQRAMMELGEALTAELDLQAVVRELVEKLPQLLGLRFAALYLLRGAVPASPRQLHRIAGPEHLPARLPDLPELHGHLRGHGSLTRIQQLGGLALRSPEVARLVAELAAAGVEAVGGLHSPRRPLGLVLLSEKEGNLLLGQEELDLLQGLLHHAALALETSLLLEERTQRAELERELEIAASIQAQLLPGSLKFAAGWDVAALCRPARIVGGDFYAQLPAPGGESTAVVYGDVSGKSVSGALMMMAAHEALYALAMTQPHPSELFTLANRRVYGLGRRSFVALGYFAANDGAAAAAADRGRLTYLVAGQPPPLWRRRDGTVTELPLPEYRIPVGALPGGTYRALEVVVAPGDVVLGYSDGVTDARSPAGEFFGSERLQDVVARASGDPRRLIRDVLVAVEAFTESGAQFDDLTLVAVGRRTEDG